MTAEGLNPGEAEANVDQVRAQSVDTLAARISEINKAKMALEVVRGKKRAWGLLKTDTSNEEKALEAAKTAAYNDGYKAAEAAGGTYDPVTEAFLRMKQSDPAAAAMSDIDYIKKNEPLIAEIQRDMGAIAATDPDNRPETNPVSETGETSDSIEPAAAGTPSIGQAVKGGFAEGVNQAFESAGYQGPISGNSTEQTAAATTPAPAEPFTPEEIKLGEDYKKFSEEGDALDSSGERTAVMPAAPAKEPAVLSPGSEGPTELLRPVLAPETRGAGEPPKEPPVDGGIKDKAKGLVKELISDESTGGPAKAAGGGAGKPPEGPGGPTPPEEPKSPEAPKAPTEKIEDVVARVEKSLEKITDEKTRKQVESALGVNRRETEDSEKRYGKGLWGAIKKWTGETAVGRMVWGGGKLLAGAGLLALSESALMTGAVGALVAPSLFAHGARLGGEGILQLIEGASSLKLDKKLNVTRKEVNGLTAEIAAELAKPEPDSKILSERARAIRGLEAEILDSKATMLEKRAKWSMAGLWGGGVTALTGAALAGLPTGIQAMGGIKIAGQLAAQPGHATFLDPLKGWMFGYHPGGELAHVSAAAQNAGWALDGTKSVGAVGFNGVGHSLGHVFWPGVAGVAIAGATMMVAMKKEGAYVEELKKQAKTMRGESEAIKDDPFGEEAADKKAKEEAGKTLTDAKPETPPDSPDGGKPGGGKADAGAPDTGTPDAEEPGKPDEAPGVDDGKPKTGEPGADDEGPKPDEPGAEKDEEEEKKTGFENGKIYPAKIGKHDHENTYHGEIDGKKVLYVIIDDLEKDEDVADKAMDVKVVKSKMVTKKGAEVHVTIHHEKEEPAETPADTKKEKAVQAVEKAFEKGAAWKIRPGMETDKPLSGMDPNTEYHIEGFEINKPKIDKYYEREGADRLYVKLSEPDKDGQPISLEANYLVSHFDSKVIGSKKDIIAAIGGVLNKKFNDLKTPEAPADTEEPADGDEEPPAPSPEEPSTEEPPLAYKEGDKVVVKGTDDKQYTIQEFAELAGTVTLKPDDSEETITKFVEEIEPVKSPEPAPVVEEPKAGSYEMVLSDDSKVKFEAGKQLTTTRVSGEIEDVEDAPMGLSEKLAVKFVGNPDWQTFEKAELQANLEAKTANVE